MSAAQITEHPVFIQAKTRAISYNDRLDKEVRYFVFPGQRVGVYCSLLFLLHYDEFFADSVPRLQLNKYPVLTHLEQRAQVPKTLIVIGSSALLILLHLFNALASPVSNLVGWALPAYLSFKAIESPSPHDDVQWLTYWVVFGFFNFLETFAARVVLYYIPWYYAFKTLFVLWLQLPYFRVSHFFHFLPLFRLGESFLHRVTLV